MSPAATTLRGRSSLTELTLLWYGLAAGAGWWAVHLVALAALVPAACGRPWVLWLMHGATLVCAAGTVAAIASAGRLRRPGRRGHGGRRRARPLPRPAGPGSSASHPWP
ncbi:MAG: hypothetical protein R2755_22455 [Acidimicrobiales bacterium]